MKLDGPVADPRHLGLGKVHLDGRLRHFICVVLSARLSECFLSIANIYDHIIMYGAYKNPLSLMINLGIQSMLTCTITGPGHLSLDEVRLDRRS